MDANTPSSSILLLFILLTVICQSSASRNETNHNVALFINASEASAREIPKTMFGIFFEEITNGGAGGLWAELVCNRGFEAGGSNTPSNIDPWSVIGDDSYVIVSTERSSCFDRNKIALRMDVLCDHDGPETCPDGGVGIFNPGFWGMNIELGKTYKLVLYVRASQSVNITASLVGSIEPKTLATANIKASDVSNWTKVEVSMKAKGTDARSRLQLTTTGKGVIWFDQVSLMPVDTHKGHGFRKDLFKMLKDLNPGFLRFPGGCFVEGDWLRNAYRWKETIGPWEERPGHFGDVWKYWTDEGLGHLEYLQLAEDLDALPIWVFNNGISHNDHVDPSALLPFIHEILDGIEFAKGSPKSKWGSVRASLGHPEPFDLRYVAVGNEDCERQDYKGSYLKFYDAISRAYPDIKIISNCDYSSEVLDLPAHYYDYHLYDHANVVFEQARKFDKAPRGGPKAFVSEYAVNGDEVGKGSLLAALAEAGFVIGLERNCDVVEMACYAPMLVLENPDDTKWKTDAIVFNSSKVYGTPSYWMQHFFKESNGGATLLNATLQAGVESFLVASAIMWTNTEDNNKYLRVKVVNYGRKRVTLQISIDGLELNSIQSQGWIKTELTSADDMDENSFEHPNKIVPVKSLLEDAAEEMDIMLSPRSLTSIDLPIYPNSRIVGFDSVL
ncbi:alpha-L-arabinofuranosidase 1-like [Henckelia pumila]|uniref:alpha-L-arabinofuranosidase 1-like n=1 Tax=Henckelia pumila TaxID=405737 RepID=UPI003C6E5CF6